MAAVVSMSGKINSGLTTNRAQLQAAIMKMRPQNLYRMTGSECPNIDYYHADLIENKHNSSALEAAIRLSVVVLQTFANEMQQNLVAQGCLT